MSEEKSNTARSASARRLVIDNPLIGEFFARHPLEVAACIIHWIHTPDCSPWARKAIRSGLEMDGSQLHGLGWYDCPTCCDSGRFSKNDEWVDCTDCKQNRN